MIAMSDAQIVDTNGAGDAFVGGEFSHSEKNDESIILRLMVKPNLECNYTFLTGLASKRIPFVAKSIGKV